MDLNRIRERLTSASVTVTRLADGTGVLLDIGGRNVYSFNPTGMDLIESLMGGSDDIGEMTEMLVRKYDVALDSARVDAEEFFRRLSDFLEKG